MFSKQRPSERRREQGAAILTAIIALVLISIILVAISKSFVMRSTASWKLASMTNAYRSADAQLYALMDEAWLGSPDLTAGKHVSGNFSWQVTILDAGTGANAVGGLLKIEVWSSFLMPGGTTTTADGRAGYMAGYKFHDF